MKIIGSTPAQLQIEIAPWNRRAIILAIKQLFGIDMPEYLRCWGFTPRRPVKHALEQDPARLKTSNEDEYPMIITHTKAEDAEIYWGDETALRQDRRRTPRKSAHMHGAHHCDARSGAFVFQA